MSNNDDFDPFQLREKTPPKQRPVLIAVNQGEPTPFELSGGMSFESAGSFDPFGISALQQHHQQKLQHSPQQLQQPLQPRALRSDSLKPPPQVNRVTRALPIVALPPKMLIKLSVHEEVSSSAKPGQEREGTSEVSVEGTVFAQIQCSDATRNAPFVVHASPAKASVWSIRPNPKYARQSEDEPIVRVPKQEIGFVPVAHYSFSSEVEHMPILLERKVTIHDTSCRIAVQVRSKLSNLGGLDNFSIAVAVPEKIDGSTVEILRGTGKWDELKRVITWSLNTLSKGESFMVSAQAKLWNILEAGEEIRFPVMMRCESHDDSISGIQVAALEAEGNPASITYSQVQQSFRLLHRLT